jgi:hypothetical protein
MVCGWTGMHRTVTTPFIHELLETWIPSIDGSSIPIPIAFSSVLHPSMATMMRNQHHTVRWHLPLLVTVAIMMLMMTTFAVVVQAGPSETIIGIQGKDFVLLAADGSLGNAGAVLTTQNLDKIRTFPAVGCTNNDVWSNTGGGSAAAVAAMGDPADVDHVLRRLQRASRLSALNWQGRQHTIVYDCATGQPPPPQQKIGGTTISPPTSAAAWTVNCLAEALRYEVYRRLRTASPIQDSAFLIAGMISESPPNANNNRDQNAASSDISSVQRQIQNASQGFRNDLFVGAESGADDDAEKMRPQRSIVDHHQWHPQPALFWLDQYYGALQKVTYGAHGHAASLLWSTLDRGWRPDLSLTDAMALLDDCLHRLQERFLFNPGSRPTFCIKCIDRHGCRRLS